MRSIFTEATRKNIVESFRHIANNKRNGTIGAIACFDEIICSTTLNVLHDQGLLTDYNYDELENLLNQLKLWDYDDVFPSAIIDNVENIVCREWKWQSQQPIWSYPLPFSLAHAICQTLTNVQSANPNGLDRWNDLHGFMDAFNIVDHYVLERLHKLAITVHSGLYSGNDETLKREVFEITGTDG